MISLISSGLNPIVLFISSFSSNKITVGTLLTLYFTAISGLSNGFIHILYLFYLINPTPLHTDYNHFSQISLFFSFFLSPSILYKKHNILCFA